MAEAGRQGEEAPGDAWHHRSDRELQLALDAAGMGWWHFDPATNSVEGDERCAEIFGLTDRRRANEAVMSIVHPEDRDRVEAAVQAALDPARPAPYSAVYRIVRPLDGEVRWVEAHGQATFDGAGPGRRATSLVGTVADVTSRRAVEARLAYLASFPERNPAPIVEADLSGRVKYANQTARGLFPEIEAQGTAHPWLSGWESLAASIAAGGAASRSRTVTVGDRVYHQELVYSEAEGLVRAYGVDITARHRAEAALERSRQGLSRLAEASQAVMARTDLAGMLQAVAEAALALTGARLATCGHGLVNGRLMVGGSARAAGAPACPPGDMYEVVRGGVHMELVEGAESLRLDDAALGAHPRWWGLPAGHVPMRGLLGVPMLTRTGRANGLILVTDKAEGAFSDEDESLLRQLATVASLALQHVEARMALEAADRHKNQFLAMLSHELRNPLAPIRNSLQLLALAAPGSEAARRAQAVIDRQVAHLTFLVDDLLDVTRISSGKIQLHREPLDLAEVVRRALEDHRAELTAAGLAVQVELPAGPVGVDGDRTRLAQVMGNLLQNAAKFTPAGGAVTVSVAVDAPAAQAVVRVRDTGAGISAEMLPRLFQPFTQADTTLDRSKGGLGLGLALTKGLVELHGGTVRAESRGLGLGAEFVVALPLRADLAHPAAPATARRGAGGHRRVLVIEDNVDAAESLGELLRLFGHEAEVAYDGSAGLERARAFRPDLVLCDVGLPGLDGYQVARLLRADPGLRSATVVALTGYAGPDDVARSKAAGFDQHLAKPIAIRDLERVLSAAGGAPA